jgi:hypothetical protein
VPQPTDNNVTRSQIVGVPPGCEVDLPHAGQSDVTFGL